METTQFICARASEFKDLILKRQPSARPINDCFIWLSGAVRLFSERLITWLSMAAIITFISSGVLFVARQFLPTWDINTIWQPLEGFCFIGGLIIAAASLAEQDDLNIAYLFSGFRYKFFELFTLYAMTLVLVGIPFGALYLFMPEMLNATSDTLWGSPAVMFTAFSMALFALMILWFAPALIVLHDINPFKAIKMSLHASRNNLLTMFVFCLLASVIGYGVYHNLPKIVPALIETVGNDMTIVIAVFLSSLSVVFIALILYVAYRNVWTNLELH
ncbi:hypothetical protein ACKLNO_04375 [Neisseriaceae bacterium B1]